MREPTIGERKVAALRTLNRQFPNARRIILSFADNTFYANVFVPGKRVAPTVVVEETL